MKDKIIRITAGTSFGAAAGALVLAGVSPLSWAAGGVIAGACFLYGVGGFYFTSEHRKKQALEEARYRSVTQRQMIPAMRKNQTYRPLSEDIGEHTTLIMQGKRFAEQIDKANRLIPDEDITSDLNMISSCIHDIFKIASEDASCEKEIRKFSRIYLPMTLKLLNNYLDLARRKVSDDAVIENQQKIAETIGNAKAAFCQLNEDLLEKTGMELDAEIATLGNILEVDGLIGNGRIELELPREEEVKIENE